MKKTSNLLLLALLFAHVHAQEKGMHFEHNTTWEKVLAKAKSENKYTFVDCYTTWCGPCKWMASNTFPDTAVGNFFNANYVNVKAQIDTLPAKDDDEIKNWYATSHNISVKYNIQSYPTYLIFNPDGELVHRFVGSMDAKEFILKGKATLLHENQYYYQLKKYIDGERNSAFLYKMAFAAITADDEKNAGAIANTYLATQTNLYNQDNLKLITSTTNKSSDFGFKLLLNNQQRVDSVLGNQRANNIVRWIIFSEEINPTLQKNGAEIKPDWVKIEHKLYLKYPTIAKKTTLFAKSFYYGRNQDWKNFTLTANDYVKNTKHPIASELNQFAWQIFQASNNKTYLKNALIWSKLSFTNQAIVEPGFIDTYANLLYKLGEKKQALAWEYKAQNIAIKGGADKSWGQDVIDKINKGEKTW